MLGYIAFVYKGGRVSPWFPNARHGRDRSAGYNVPIRSTRTRAACTWRCTMGRSEGRTVVCRTKRAAVRDEIPVRVQSSRAHLRLAGGRSTESEGGICARCGKNKQVRRGSFRLSTKGEGGALAPFPNARPSQFWREFTHL